MTFKYTCTALLFSHPLNLYEYLTNTLIKTPEETIETPCVNSLTYDHSPEHVDILEG
jgi:hypothetical protein